MITTDDKNTPDEREMSNMSDRDLFLVMIKDIEKRLSTVGLAFKGVNELLKRYEGRIAKLEAKSQPQDHITDSSKKIKPTRYYPNGAYMDEPEIGTPYWIQGEYSEVISSQTDGFSWEGDRLEMDRLERQEIFPTEESCKKDRRRDELTAKMYRDMRDERINGDWVHEDFALGWIPCLGGDSTYATGVVSPSCHSFVYRSEDFIDDLKRSFSWTEEELKIVWFGV